MTEDLIEQRAIMLQKQPQDLQQVREQVLKSWWEAVKQLEKMKKKNIVDFNFEPGSLVIVHNTKFYKTLSDKTKPQYFGLMVVIRCTNGGSYMLRELYGDKWVCEGC